MFIVSNFLSSIARVLDMGFGFFFWVLLIRCLISWVNPDPYNTVVQFLYKVTEPVLSPIRRIIPPAWGIGIDLSPLVAVLLLTLLQHFVVTTLYDIAARLR